MCHWRILSKTKRAWFKCVGIDVNSEYIAKAKKNGVKAYVMNGNSLSFKDNSFDTVLLFEVLEHVECPDIIVFCTRLAGHIESLL